MELPPPGSLILFVRGASIVRGEGRRPDEEECGFGGVYVRTLLRLPAAAHCPAALGKRGPPLVELAPLPPLAHLVPSCVFHSPRPRPTRGVPCSPAPPSSQAATPAVRVRYLLSKDRSAPGVPSFGRPATECLLGC